MMKTLIVHALLAALALSQSPVLSAPSPITESANLEVIADAPFVTRDVTCLTKMAKREEASHALEKRDHRYCVSTASYLLSSSILRAGKLGWITN